MSITSPQERETLFPDMQSLSHSERKKKTTNNNSKNICFNVSILLFSYTIEGALG